MKIIRESDRRRIDMSSCFPAIAVTSGLNTVNKYSEVTAHEDEKISDVSRTNGCLSIHTVRWPLDENLPLILIHVTLLYIVHVLSRIKVQLIATIPQFPPQLGL
jgi:hypothetical protein